MSRRAGRKRIGGPIQTVVTLADQVFRIGRMTLPPLLHMVARSSRRLCGKGQHPHDVESEPASRGVEPQDGFPELRRVPPQTLPDVVQVLELTDLDEQPASR